MTQNNLNTHLEEIVSIAYKLVPLPSGCSNCWGDLGEGCTDECRSSSNKHSEKIDEAKTLIHALINKAVIQARIEELRLLQNFHLYELDGSACEDTRQQSNKLYEYIISRINQLQKEISNENT